MGRVSDRTAVAHGPHHLTPLLPRQAMRETLPLLTTDMAEKTVQNEEEGWRDEGHEYIGQPVLRSFKEQGVETWSTGKITRWLPPTEEEPETVFHVVHDDDGDEEDLDQAEADEARTQYDEKTAGGVEALTALQAQPVYENSYERLKKEYDPHGRLLGLYEKVVEQR